MVNITATRCTETFSVNKLSLRQTIYLILSPIFLQVRSFPPAYCVKLQFSSELPKTLKSFYMVYLHFFFQSNALKLFNLSTQIRPIKGIYRSLLYGKKWLLECLRSKVIMKLILEKNCQMWSANFSAKLAKILD